MFLIVLGLSVGVAVVGAAEAAKLDFRFLDFLAFAIRQYMDLFCVTGRVSAETARSDDAFACTRVDMNDGVPVLEQGAKVVQTGTCLCCIR